MTAELIDIAALDAARLETDPYPFVIVPAFLKPEAAARVQADFPDIKVPGSVPLASVSCGKVFSQFMNEIQGPEMTAAIAKKFGIDLTKRPTMVTVRGRIRPTDGKIHTDSKTKLITVLIYMNGKWEQAGGKLRILRSPENLNDKVAEVPPVEGTLLAFRNQANAWHGHEPCEGERRAIQLNWVTDRGVVMREQIRHRISAFFKKHSY